MEIKTREELEKALIGLENLADRFANFVDTEDAKTAHTRMIEHRKQILDALFPKPESQRLRQLRYLLTDTTWHKYANWGLVKDLVDTAIKEEESKS